LEFDRAHLNQVLWNLLNNAWRHCRSSPEAAHHGFTRANRVELHVIDDGEGVARSCKRSCFEPFFTTFASGTGLGLYIARELCAANGASLEYWTRSGRGFKDPMAEP